MFNRKHPNACDYCSIDENLTVLAVLYNNVVHLTREMSNKGAKLYDIQHN